MADREISYALRVICAAPEVLSSYDKDRLLAALSQNLTGVPISTMVATRASIFAFLCQYQMAVPYQVGDEVVEVRPDYGHRRGKIVCITPERYEIGQSQRVPVADPSRNVYYVAGIGEGWSKCSATNHEWHRYVAPGFPIRLQPGDPVPAGDEKHAYGKVMSAWEPTFRVEWVKATDF